MSYQINPYLIYLFFTEKLKLLSIFKYLFTFKAERE